METTNNELEVESAMKEMIASQETYLANAKVSNEESDSDEQSELSLDSDLTEINITKEQILKRENTIKETFERRLDIAGLERPGICNIFPRAEYNFVHSEEYLEELKSQTRLWEIADKLFKIERKVLDDKSLSDNYEDKYIKFKYLKSEELHKYSPLDEDEFLK